VEGGGRLKRVTAEKTDGQLKKKGGDHQRREEQRIGETELPPEVSGCLARERKKTENAAGDDSASAGSVKGEKEERVKNRFTEITATEGYECPRGNEIHGGG